MKVWFKLFRENSGQKANNQSGRSTRAPTTNTAAAVLFHSFASCLVDLLASRKFKKNEKKVGLDEGKKSSTMAKVLTVAASPFPLFPQN